MKGFVLINGNYTRRNLNLPDTNMLQVLKCLKIEKILLCSVN